MIGNANENRFVAFNDTPLIRTKHIKYQSPYFGNWADHSLDEFIKNPSDIRDENATHQNYKPSYVLVHKDLSSGLPNFDRYISKEKGGVRQKEVLGMKHTPNPYAINAVRQGYYSTHVKARNERDVVPFKI